MKATHFPYLRMGPFYEESELADAMTRTSEQIQRLADMHLILRFLADEDGRVGVFYSAQMLDDRLKPIPGIPTMFDVLHQGLGWSETMVTMWLGGPFEEWSQDRPEPDLRPRMAHLREGNFGGVYESALARVPSEAFRTTLRLTDPAAWLADVEAARRAEPEPDS